MTETQPSVESASQLLRPTEVADMLHVHPRTLQRMAERGQIKAIFLPSGHRRYRANEITQLVNGTHPAQQLAPTPAGFARCDADNTKVA